MELDVWRGLLTRILMPLPFGLGLAVCAGAAAVALRRRPRLRRLAGALAAFGVLLVWIAALPWTETALFRALETSYPPRPAAACGGAGQPVDSIVVLGGAIYPRKRGDARGRLHRGSDRLREAALLFHAGCAPRVLISAGGSPDDSGMGREARAIRELMLEFGLPASALIFEDQSRSTEENARYSALMIGSAETRTRILLVTSAWHLRRAVPLFERQGFDVVPVGSDYRGQSRCIGLTCLLPDSRALDATGIAWKEFVAYWVQVRR